MNRHEIHILPAGKYYICDPCYVIDSNKWDQFLDIMDGNSYFGYNGKQYVCLHTYFGDGSYPSNHDNYEGNTLIFDVDSGMIGAIPLDSEFLNTNESLNEDYIFEFTEPFECKNNNGKLIFSNVVIDTYNQFWDSEREYDE